jgi:hypothetical protein
VEPRDGNRPYFLFQKPEARSVIIGKEEKSEEEERGEEGGV